MTSNIGRGLSLLVTNPAPTGPNRLVMEGDLGRAVTLLGRRCSCIVVSATPMNLMTSALRLDGLTSEALFIYHTSFSAGSDFACVGGLSRRGGLPGVSVMVGSVSLSGGGFTCDCKFNGCDGGNGHSFNSCNLFDGGAGSSDVGV